MANIFQTAWSNVISTLQKPQRTRAIQLYAQRLGRLLQAKYGKQETYAPAQVKATMREWGYPLHHSSYGLAMYCDRIDFDDHYRSIGEPCDYDAMRGEVSNCLFSNEVTTFSASSLVESNFNFGLSGYHQQPDSGGQTAGHYYPDSGNYDGGSYGGGSYDGGGSCGAGDAGGGSYDGGGSCGAGDGGGGGGY